MSDTESGNSRPDWLKGNPEESTPMAGGPANNPSPPSGTQSANGEHWLLRFQHHAGVLSHILALMAVCVVSLWVSDEAMGGGGVSWSEGDAKRVFNWHPVMMIVAFAFMTVSSLAFFMRWRSVDRMRRCAARRGRAAEPQPRRRHTTAHRVGAHLDKLAETSAQAVSNIKFMSVA